MRKLALTLLLPLVMLLAQHGAVVHELSHLDQPPASGSRHGAAPHDALCLSCLAYAGIGSAARPDAFQALLLSFSQPLSAPVAAAVLDAEALAPRSRGPPFLL